MIWFGLVWYFLPSNDDLWLTSPQWEEERGWRALWSTHLNSLFWYFFQAMMTSDLPLLGEKKIGDGERYGAHFSLVWFGIYSKQWRPLTYLSSARRRAGMASIDLVWFDLLYKQCRPLTYISSARRSGVASAVEHTFHWFGLVCFTCSDDLWPTSPRWKERGWQGLWITLFIGLVWYVLHATTTSDLPLLDEKSGDGEDCESHFSLVWFGLFYKQ